MSKTAVEEQPPTAQQACRACGLIRVKRLFIIGGNRVLRCLDCGHTYLDVIHDPESIRRMYETYETGMQFYFQDVDDEVIQNIDRYLKRCRDYCARSGRKPRLLDIGCGAGILLERAKAQGFICEGVEICEPLAKTARERVGCGIHRAFLEDLNLPDNTFDVVTMYDLVEHLQHPVQEIRRAQRLLHPGGILFILTPNNDALIRRVAQWSYRLTLHQFQRPLRALYYSHHLSYFSSDSLQTLLHRVGFHVLRTETRNPELSRLTLSNTERRAVRALFRVSELFPSLGGKLILWAKK
jgi:2-polyprenyl-3-methyl-5-hydroxy-6-metoxy-1,4-benzoquinol methylase